ncbi:hypothetical protein NJB1907f44_26710 [Mycobacterium marinum]|nr:hypothetical protein MMRN_22920 [Mycobacterium marinum]GJO00493.1 hypothetical protein NJB1907f34b_15660 [Mycobacterium marinum]GJO20079.1 hypothetical protein NJB1907E90_50340 [Mycobacterium marinum]GJO23916.1 hypothetical protein NJB1907f22_08990 [Mycobacterium marinum]GJO24941.1 hypothetical protein NJB1907E11_38910 [Mycobacterium marinum]
MVDVDALEHARHLGAVDLGVPHPKGLHPRPLHQLEDLVTILLTHGIPEDGAQQSDVGSHWFGSLAANPGPVDVANGLECGIGHLNHVSQYQGPTRPAPVVDRLFGRLLVMELALQITLVITSVLVVLLVLLHRAKGGGLSTLFGGGVQSSLSGSTVVEKNLDRLTLFITGIWLVSIVGVALLIKYR